MERPGQMVYPPKAKKPKRKRGWLKFVAWSFAAMFVLGVAAVIAAAIYVVRISADVPEVVDLQAYEPPVMSRVHAGDGRLIAEYAEESRVFVSIETIPPLVTQAFISAEDKNFYQHGGIDYYATFKALVRTAINKVRGSGGLQGGSTITQQVAKNFKLSSERTIDRKVREAIVARRLESAFTKPKILELYLNEIFLGRRSYGVAAASLLYFGKPLDELTLDEAAFLAALPKAPSNYNPERNYERAIGRRNWVIGRMLANGYVTEAEAEEARLRPLEVVERLSGSTYEASAYFVEESRRRIATLYGEEQLYQGGLSIRTTLDTNLQIAATKALRRGLESYDRRKGYRGAIATIDVSGDWRETLAEVERPDGLGDHQMAVVLGVDADKATIGIAGIDAPGAHIPLAELMWARRVLADRSLGEEITSPAEVVSVGDVILVDQPIDSIDEETGAAPDGAYALVQIPEIEGGLMAMDPHTGRVLALVGGYSFRQSQFNRATQADRQPGSAFKPFVYAAALDNGYTPSSIVLDAPYVSFSNQGGTAYKPTNYTGRWNGPSTLRVGIEQSKNAMTVRLANEIGLETVSAYGERFGIYDDLPPFESMSLGAGETTLSRLVSAYATLVNGGKQVEPTLIDRVQDRRGTTVFRHDQRVCVGCSFETLAPDDDLPPEPTLPDERAQIVDPVTAYQIVAMLEGVVERGSGTRVKRVGKPLAGKTGTTNDFFDAWFVGFSPDLVAGVFVGFDSPSSLGFGEAGGRVAAPIFADFMDMALAERPATPFRVPAGVSLVRVDPKTGLRARPGEPFILEAFRAGTEPPFDDPGVNPEGQGGVRYGGVDTWRDEGGVSYGGAATSAGGVSYGSGQSWSQGGAASAPGEWSGADSAAPWGGGQPTAPTPDGFGQPAYDGTASPEGASFPYDSGLNTPGATNPAATGFGLRGSADAAAPGADTAMWAGQGAAGLPGAPRGPVPLGPDGRPLILPDVSGLPLGAAVPGIPGATVGPGGTILMPAEDDPADEDLGGLF